MCRGSQQCSGSQQASKVSWAAEEQQLLPWLALVKQGQASGPSSSSRKSSSRRRRRRCCRSGSS